MLDVYFISTVLMHNRDVVTGRSLLLCSPLISVMYVLVLCCQGLVSSDHCSLPGPCLSFHSVCKVLYIKSDPSFWSHAVPIL